MRVLFMGTPEYAVPSLKKLHEKHEIVGIVTRADKPNKRGNKIVFSPVKQFAVDNNIPVFQPESLRSKEIYDELAALKPDISAVVAYGIMIPDDIINMPRYKTINIHGSLLPKYRGAAPMQYSVLNGDSEAGVSIMYITKDLDAGDVLLSRSIPVGENETFGELHDRLADLGADALLDALSMIESGNAAAVPQDSSKATFAPSITKEECVIDWSLDNTIVHNRIRGLSPIPCANTHLDDGRLLKVYRSEKISAEDFPDDAPKDAAPGTVIYVIKKKGPVVLCGKGAVCILSAKPEGKKEMPGFELVNGHYLAAGMHLG